MPHIVKVSASLFTRRLIKIEKKVYVTMAKTTKVSFPYERKTNWEEAIQMPLQKVEMPVCIQGTS